MYGDVYDVYLYLLLNYNGQFDFLSIFMYEWGYVIYMMLVKEQNPYEMVGYVTFIVEIVFMINEVLFQEYMFGQEIIDEEWLFYLGIVLEVVWGTFFRQVMFVEFELVIYQLVEIGEVFFGEKMIEVYGGLLRWYYGVDQGVMVIDLVYVVEWVFILYFYWNFYVFQYVIFIVGGTMFVERFLSGDGQVWDDYLVVFFGWWFMLCLRVVEGIWD